MMEQKFNIIDKLNLHLNVQEVYEKYNHTKQNIEIKTLHKIVSDAAYKFPDNVAVIEGENKIRYWEIEEKSNQIANFLLEKKTEENELVGVVASRKINTIINILGILKSGCAYVPIDPEYPEDRVNYIKDNSNCNIILNEGTYDTEKLSCFDNKTVPLEVDINSLAYVIYTSGSTGVPKGVEITHKAACNTIIDINTKYKVNQNDKIIALSSMCFDLSVFDIFGALSAGAVLVQIADQRDIKNIMEVMKQNKITIWNSIPSTMGILVDNIKFTDNNNDLRLVLLSGDWIPLNLPNKIKEHFANSNVISLGGATEAAIWSIYYPIEKIQNNWKNIPYGIPLANQTIYILNYEQKLCPEGIEGEIYIGGDGLALGYKNDKEKTEKAFINHSEFGRIYRTGDYGILNRAGYVEFNGRKDSQVKIRGYRVELGEVEAVMNTCDGIKASVVAVKKDSFNNNYLCGYYVINDEISQDSIMEHLQKLLPQYMVPTKLIRIEQIPLNVNGKVDRKSLPEPVDINIKNESYIAPSNEMQLQLAEIFEKAFDGKAKVGMKDNFYELGLNSILMVGIIAEINSSFDIQIKFKDFLKLNNIEDLENLVRTSETLPSSEYTESDEPVSENNDEMYFWSPIIQWKIENEVLTIGGEVYVEEIYKDLLPNLYFLTQGGCNLEAVMNEFNNFSRVDLKAALDKLRANKILINEIVKIEDLFSSQDHLLQHSYGDDLLLKKEVYDQYKTEQLSRQLTYSVEKIIKIDKNINVPESISERFSHREFDRENRISFHAFSMMISTFKQNKEEEHKFYYYASAGGLYPIDVFVYAKENRIENVDSGLYYYNPIDNQLWLIEDKDCITSDAHYFTNKSIFNESAFSVYFVYNANVSMPRYRGAGYLYSLIDTGIMVSTLTQMCQNLNIGVCSIGDMNFERVEPHFHLGKNQIFLHCVEGGYKINKCRNSYEK